MNGKNIPETPGPEGWMAEQPESVLPAASEPESVRQWYDRTTRRWRKALLWATLVSVVVVGLMFALLSFTLLAKLQTLNGATVIPIGAAIWIAAFVYIFLIPNREVGFRSMESLERMERRMTAAVTEKVFPAVAVWKRIGERVERELPAFLVEAREFFANAKTALQKLDTAASKNEAIAEDAKPAIEALKRISDRIEKEHILDEAKAAFESVKTMGGIPKNPTEPDISRTLAAIRKR